MTFKFMRPALTIALALTLAACGGKASFTVAGSVTGLRFPGLVLTSNGMDLAMTPNSSSTDLTAAPVTSSFAFPNSISYGDVYAVSVKTPALHQDCTVGAYSDGAGKVHGGATDTAGRLATIDVGVLCTVTPHSIGGNISGLTATMTGLVLTNGSDPAFFTVVPATTATTPFTFANKVPYGTTYGVTVLTQPTGAVCTVAPNGAGVMGDTDVGDIAISCVATTTP